jgi:Tfp pilus assembly protein PilF
MKKAGEESCEDCFQAHRIILRPWLIPLKMAFHSVASMNKDMRTILRMAGGIILCLGILSACTHQSRKPSSSSQTYIPTVGTGSATSPLEKELVATVTNAERLGPGNPLLLSSLYSLAAYYEDRKEYDKAANQYERALQLKEEANGPNHPDVAAILRRYARMLQEAKRPSEAASLLTRADAILPLTPSPSTRQ